MSRRKQPTIYSCTMGGPWVRMSVSPKLTDRIYDDIPAPVLSCMVRGPYSAVSASGSPRFLDRLGPSQRLFEEDEIPFLLGDFT